MDSLDQDLNSFRIQHIQNLIICREHRKKHGLIDNPVVDDIKYNCQEEECSIDCPFTELYEKVTGVKFHERNSQK